jgi:hypothetical protein
MTNTRAGVLSFRGVVDEAMVSFLAQTGAQALAGPEVLTELVVGLSRYREEGTRLSPSVFLCDDLPQLLQALEGGDALQLGEGPPTVETVRRLLKLGAPLATSGWSLYAEAKHERWRFGLFRSDAFMLKPSAFGLLRDLPVGRLKVLGVVQLAESVVELRSSGDRVRYVYLSGASINSRPPLLVVEDLVPALVRQVPAAVRDDVGTFFLRVLLDAMRAPHGCLLAVVPSGAPVPPELTDGMLFEHPISVRDAVARFHEERSLEARARVQGAASLLLGMLGSDGVTLVSDDGLILGANVFLAQVARAPQVIGGARRRAWTELARSVGVTLSAAFTRSQDGVAEGRIAPQDGRTP